LSRRKKSEIHNRAKRLLGAFASEARKQALVCGQRRLIRAQYEKGLLVLKEDFVRLPYMHIPPRPSQVADPYSYAELPNPSTKDMQILFSKATATRPKVMDETQLNNKEKLRLVLYEIVQMYSLQFKIADSLLGILKSELQKF
jgi:hypothetical protein